MPDTWTLVTPTGNYTLNRTFHAPKYQPGGVDTNAALRRDGRTTYQRSGDGLPTPGPLVLRGRVWNDAWDIAALVDELEAIQEAAATCIEVIRTTDAGRYVYDDLSGGPPPEVTPDGLGGWEVTIELWPGRALPTFVPPGFTNEWDLYRQSTSGGGWSYSIDDDLLAVFMTETSGRQDNIVNPQILSWEGIRDAKAGKADYDAVARTRVVATVSTSSGVVLYARLPPKNGYAPGVGNAHLLHRYGGTLRIYHGVYGAGVPSGAEHLFDQGMEIGAWYWMRLQVTRSGSFETLRGKMWRDGATEPDWQVTRTDSVSSNTPALGGAIGVSNGAAVTAGSGPTLARYEWDRVSDLEL